MEFNKKIFLMLFLVIFAGCRNLPVSSFSDGREIIDDLGKKVVLPARVERAISLAPNLTEIAFAVGAGDRLIGVTTFCDYPAEAKKIQKIGDTMNPNLETIIALKPQVVLISTASQIENFSKTLESNGIAVFVTNPDSLDSIYRAIIQFGEIFGEKQKAGELNGILRKRVARIESLCGNAEVAKTFVQISSEPLYTIGKESFLSDLIGRAGGISVTADIPSAYPKISKETALAMQPEAIILSESPDNLEPNEVFINSPAVANKKVFKINADLLSRPGPRAVDALEQIAKSLHPELTEN